MWRQGRSANEQGWERFFFFGGHLEDQLQVEDTSAAGRGFQTNGGGVEKATGESEEEERRRQVGMD